MIHGDRAYAVKDVATAEELASLLSEMTWCGCNGFRLDDVLYLNDAFSPDGAQEYAVIEVTAEDGDGWDGIQFESITASWMDEPELLDTIRKYEDPAYRARMMGGAAMNVPLHVDRHPEGPCCICA